MADDTIASVIALHQPKRARNGAQRVRASKPRKRQKAKPVAWPDAESPSSETLIPAGFSSADSAFAGSPDAPSPTVTLPAVTPSHRSLASIFLVAAALALAGGGITTTGWVDREHGAAGRANARGNGGSIGIDGRHVCAGSGVRERRWQVLPRTRNDGRRTAPDPRHRHRLGREGGRPSN